MAKFTKCSTEFIDSPLPHDERPRKHRMPLKMMMMVVMMPEKDDEEQLCFLDVDIGILTRLLIIFIDWLKVSLLLNAFENFIK